MDIIVRYVMNMIPYMLGVLPFYIVFRIIYFKRIARKINWYHEVTLVVFVMFLVGLGSQALVSNDRVHSTNLTPFVVFKDTYREVFINGNISYFLINFLGNIIMFMPIGFFVPLLWNISYKRTVIIGISFSLFIEVSQLFLRRGTDIDDLILNTIGVCLGVLIIIFIQKHFKWFLSIYKYYD